MNPSLQVGNQIITAENIFSLLAEKQMILPLAKELIIDQAIAEIECTPEEKQMAQQQFFTQMQINPNDSEKFESWLQKNYLTKEQLQQRILRGVKLEKFKQETWGNQLNSYYRQRKQQLDKVVYSLIRTKNPGEAQELYFRITEGEKDFTEVAKQYSQGAEAETGGLIGPVELNVPHPTIAQKLVTAQVGQVIPPFRVSEWIVILRLEKYITAQLDQYTSRKLLDELFNTWMNKQLQEEVKFNSEIKEDESTET